MPPKYVIVAKDVRGIVLSSAHSTHGRISTSNHGNVYYNIDNVQANEFGLKELFADQHVVFNVIRGPKGFQAKKIRVEANDICSADMRESKRGRNRDRDRFRPTSYDSYSAYCGCGDRSPSPFSTCSVASSFADFELTDDKFHVDIIEHDLRGEVNRYDARKGFGFVTVPEYGSVFCHISRIEGGVHLTPSQMVRCDVGRNKKGQLAVVNVRVLPAAGQRLPSHTRSRTSHSPANSQASRSSMNTNEDDVHTAVGQLGEVVSFNSRKKFGFIRVQGISQNVFVSRSGLKCVSDLRANQVVRCDVVTSPTKTKAVNVVVIGDDESSSQSKNVPDSLCDICGDFLEDPVSLHCGHVFCRDCIKEWTAVNPNCPVDGDSLSNKTLKQLR